MLGYHHFSIKAYNKGNLTRLNCDHAHQTPKETIKGKEEFTTSINAVVTPLQLANCHKIGFVEKFCGLTLCL